jgi:glucokinase
MYIVFDIGGTHLRLASSKDGKQLDQVQTFSTPQNFDEAIELMAVEIPKLAGDESIIAIAGGVPGILNKAHTNMVHSTNLPQWAGKPLAKSLTNIFHCPVRLGNDGVLGALGEAHFGSGQNMDSVVYVTIGTGIGGGWILDGKRVLGNYSVDIGHQIIDPNGPLCSSCRQPGHLEAYLDHPDFQKYFAIGLFNTLLHWPAETIILGGGKVLHENWDLNMIEDNLQELRKNYPQHVKIAMTSLGDHGGMYGALALLSQ